ncbi:hypothetical protein [Flavobacterium sp. NKUCC04_CG]|uniref:hypothetical protein n=1 Tax=Flavobacterium sp. NKUCC04_CG TaxID=2842121 RepID=UPI001C5B676F|nr:hypothetical protein [Flavobacterium sp. NKUCC04_CG]MBW3520205.1 hypothetical protein [Flavobacterium sp. NKUCC04_CG]
MKSLNTDQIGIIEEILLEKYNLKYDHLRVEILDHIASETEALIYKEALPFDLALKTVFKLWHKELQTKKLGMYKNIPRMVAALWRRLDVEFLAVFAVVSTAVFLLIRGYEVDDQVIKDGVLLVLIINMLILTETISLIFNSSQKTVLNEYVKKSVLACLGFNVYLLALSFLSYGSGQRDFGLDWGVYLPLFLGLAVLIRLILGYFTMKKSLIIEKKTLKIQ